MDKKKKISIIVPCFNEEKNINICYDSLVKLFEKDLSKYDYEIIFCDNCSKDLSVKYIKEICNKDKNVKAILNSRNFGASRSAFNGLINSSGDAVLYIMAADLQDPPELLIDFIKKWEEGYQVVYGVRTKREEDLLTTTLRKIYYRLAKQISNVELNIDVGDFQLIDRKVVEALKEHDDYYPYVRGMIASCGFESFGINYTVRRRKAGIAKGNFFTIFDLALNGIISFSNVPLRLMMFIGLFLAGSSFIYTCTTLLYILITGHKIAQPGITTIILAQFFFCGIQMFFLGIIGEYIGAIHSQVRKKPLVIEKGRLNF